MQKKDNPFPVEKKIKPLVEILNKVSFIKTTSCCEGHFSLEDVRDHKDKAHVYFEVEHKRESEFEEFAKTILAGTAYEWCDYGVEILKRYYLLPSHQDLITDYRIEISPFSHTSSGRTNQKQKRNNTDKGIKKITEIVEEYLSSKKRKWNFDAL